EKVANTNLENSVCETKVEPTLNKISSDEVEIYRATGEGSKAINILVDSGAFMHMSNDITIFQNLSSKNTNLVVKMANQTRNPVVGTGEVNLTFLDDDGAERHIKLEEVL